MAVRVTYNTFDLETECFVQSKNSLHTACTCTCRDRQKYIQFQITPICWEFTARVNCRIFCILTLIQLTWRIWWAPNHASKWQMGFNSAFKGLNDFTTVFVGNSV